MKAIIIVAFAALVGCSLAHDVDHTPAGPVFQTIADSGAAFDWESFGERLDGQEVAEQFAPDAALALPVQNVEAIGDWQEQTGSANAPILDTAVPSDACTNRDDWIALEGVYIDWRASVTISYPYSGAHTTITKDDKDHANGDLLDWQDISRIAFRTFQELEWTSGRDGRGGGFVSGYYLVHVTNPGEVESNAVGLNLQWCD